MSATLTEHPQPVADGFISGSSIQNGSSSIQDKDKDTETDTDSPYSFAHLKPYVQPPETKEELPWSELVSLDLSDLDRPGGKQRLASQLSHAVHHVGFFYVRNFGLSQAQIDRQFTLAKNFFDLPLAEKLTYEVDYAKADYNGYRRAGRFQIGSLTDNIEMYNMAKFTDDFRGRYEHPPLVKAHLAEIESFARHLHANVVLPLLRLFAIILQLPDEEYLVKQHTYDDKRSEDHLRYMKYNRRTAEEHAASGYGQSGGHTDLGTVTLLFRQPVAGLQILGEDGKWTYVAPQPGTITVNLADTLSHLTGGYLKSSIHRVVAPPRDQWDYDRTGLLYFARPHSDTLLVPITDISPVLREAGVKSRFDQPVTMGEWVKAKQTMQLNPKLYEEKRDGKDGSVELIAGYRDRRYN
jgi:isopenicillin N synthase-like dioxygenase